MTFLVIDALVSRLGILDDIKNSTDLLIKKIIGRSTKMIGLRGDFGTTEDLVLLAKKEMWVSGFALDNVSRLTSLFQQQIDRGIQIRFLAIAPNPLTVQDTSGYFNEDSGRLMSRINNNLGLIYEKLCKSNPGKVSIRITNYRLALGHFIIDPNEPDGYMRIETYTCHSDQTGRPMLQFYKKIDEQWFNIYKKDYEKLWEHSKEWSN